MQRCRRGADPGPPLQLWPTAAHQVLVLLGIVHLSHIVHHVLKLVDGVLRLGHGWVTVGVSTNRTQAGGAGV